MRYVQILKNGAISYRLSGDSDQGVNSGILCPDYCSA